MNGSKCIVVKFSECLFYKKNNISGINTPGTDKRTFSAEHTLFNIVTWQLILTAVNKNIYLAQAEGCKIASSASRGTSSAGDALFKAGFLFNDIISYPSVINIIVNLSAF
jgi:hypothetical protein